MRPKPCDATEPSWPGSRMQAASTPSFQAKLTYKQAKADILAPLKGIFETLLF